MIADLAVQAKLTPREAMECTWSELETWARAGTRLMKTQARLAYLAVGAAMAGGQAARHFMQATRDD